MIHRLRGGSSRSCEFPEMGSEGLESIRLRVNRYYTDPEPNQIDGGLRSVKTSIPSSSWELRLRLPDSG